MSDRVTAWHEAYADAVLSFVRSKGIALHDAEDICSQVFLEVLRRQDTLHDANPRSFLLTIADHRVKDYWRRQARRPADDSLDDHAVRDRAADAEVTGIAWSSLLAQLRANQRQLLTMRMEGMSLAEMADALGLTLPALKGQLHHARGALRRAAKGPMQTPIPRARLPQAARLDNRSALLARCLVLEMENETLRRAADAQTERTNHGPECKVQSMVSAGVVPDDPIVGA